VPLRNFGLPTILFTGFVDIAFTLQRFIGDTSFATMTRSLPERALGPIAGESRGTQAQH
jgi:hypothetical protein